MEERLMDQKTEPGITTMAKYQQEELNKPKPCAGV